MTCTRWHRLGERCECGHVTVPARFYWVGDKEQTHEKAEERYMEFLGQFDDVRTGVLKVYPPPTVLRKSVTKPSAVTKVTGRPKQYRNAAERQKAYRGRK